MVVPRKLRHHSPGRPLRSPDDLFDYVELPMPRRPTPQHGPASEELARVLGYPWPFAGRPSRDDLSTWAVTDDWPARVPVTATEVDVFEAWFGDVFDELFGPCQ
jgi:hypothetical protein